jgi:hypothetical protein
VVMMCVMMGAGDHVGQPNGDPSTGQRSGAPSARDSGFTGGAHANCVPDRL